MEDLSQQKIPGRRYSVAKLFLLLVGVLMLLLAVAYWRTPPEPVYQGATVSEWMSRQVPELKFGSGTQSVSIAVSPTGAVSYKFGNAVNNVRMAPRQTDETTEALLGMTAADVVPHLISMLRVQDSAVRDLAADFLKKQNVIKLRLAPADMIHARALVAFALMGMNASAAIPELSGMVSDDTVGPLACKALVLIGGDEAVGVLHQAVKGSDPEIKRRAAESLRIWIPDSEKPLIESLVDELNSDDWVYHRSAIQTLSEIGEPPEQVLPVIVPFMDSNHDRTTRAVALETLASYGTNAHPYVPQIELAFQDDSKDFRFDLIKAYRKMELNADRW